MLKIAIVEDELFWQKEVQQILRGIELEKEIDCFTSGIEFLKVAIEYDMVFMDVELGKENGFEVSQQLKQINPQSILIILTSHDEFARKGYQVEAYRYLDKGNLEEIEEAVIGGVNKLDINSAISFHVVSKGDVRIMAKNIYYIETYGRNLLVHTTIGNEECTGSISELAAKLEVHGFYYVHRSFLVNIEYVLSFSRKEVLLKNDERLSMSTKRYEEFKQFYFHWKFS